MNLNELIESILHHIHPFESLSSTLIFIGFVLCTFIQVSPIKLNPWDFLLGWVGERFNSGMNKKIDKLDERVDKMEKQIDEHIKDNKYDEVQKKRQYLVDFVTEGVNGKRHTKESFETALKVSDEYEQFFKDNKDAKIKNGVINSTIEAIRAKYEEHLIKADFPAEEYYINQGG